MKIINGSITTPKGFKATGAHIGVKKHKKDLALICSDVPATVAGCFTKNTVKAASVLWDINVNDDGGTVRGIVINSGNANACTGQQGINDNTEMAAVYGGLLGVAANEILVCSTGVICVNLPMDKITSGIKNTFPLLGSSREDAELATEAIMTTDTFKKSICVELTLDGKTVTIAGIAKGSGMIHPNMATLLSFITTDANISKKMLQQALSEIVDVTYNMISVDGDTSTNDTTLVLANGMAQNKLIDCENADYEAFKAALHAVNKKLAIDIARDGEGATKLIEATVTGAKSEDDAKKLAKSIIASSLVKAMIFGSDANCGRVLCAMGYSGGDFKQAGVDITFGSNVGEIQFMEKGNPNAFDEDMAKKILSDKDIFIKINLSDGNSSATAWGCDLTYDYVKINGDYRS